MEKTVPDRSSLIRGNPPGAGPAPSNPRLLAMLVGSVNDPERMVHLGDHPRVWMCLPCAR